jgi:hypothetical protein
MDAANSKGQYKKATKNVSFVLSTPTITSNGRRSSLVLKVLSMIITQSLIKRVAASSYLR